MRYDVKTKCQHCGKTFVLHECLDFEYPDDTDFVKPTKDELEEISFIKKPIGKYAYCEKCRQIGGLWSKKFWIPFTDIDNEFLSAITIRNCDIPKAKGVYIIVCNGKKIPNFVYPSPAGKRINKTPKDPTLSVKILKEKWVDDAHILYIGKAERSLQRRMKQHTDFWGGKDKDNAWGGRIIAQVENYGNLQVWYMKCADPKSKESELIKAFEKHYGKIPFANLRR